MPIAVAASDVERSTELMPEVDRAAAIPLLLGGGERKAADGMLGAPRGVPRRRVEAFSTSARRLVLPADGNAFAQAAEAAFYGHHPLRITPDAVWFCIAQGFAQHISLNAEALRGRFVGHEGKKKLVVERPDFFLGQPNPWPEAFAAFSSQIAKHIGKLADLVVADFSTTGPTERAASEVLLMDAFQPYFEYEMMSGCGIPTITLDGTVDDWKSVRTRAAVLSEYGLEAWIGALLPVLDELVRTAAGEGSREFWRSFFRYQSGSGPSELTGWIVTLYPYLTSHEEGKPLIPNPYVAQWEPALRRAQARTGWRFTPEGPGLGQLASSLSSAPVNFVDVRDMTKHPLRFVAGVFGVTQDPVSHELSPEFGWGIVHDELEE